MYIHSKEKKNRCVQNFEVLLSSTGSSQPFYMHDILDLNAGRSLYVLQYCSHL